MIKKVLKVSLVGRTNAGKSTLLNNLLGETVSIVNKKINTTQDLIIGIKNYKNCQFIFYDTPGVNYLKSIKKNNKKLKINLWQGIDESEIILFIIDSKNIRFSYIKDQLLKLIELHKEIIIIFNKIDLISKDSLLPIIKLIKEELNLVNCFLISAKYQYGFDHLLKFIKKFSKKNKWIFTKDEVSDKDDIFMTNECTRNSMLKYLHKEIPYNVIIKNNIFKYLKNGDLKIKQHIFINENRYKKIILGKKGEKIKLIRENSQKQISKILNVKTHLYLMVIKFNAK